MLMGASFNFLSRKHTLAPAKILNISSENSQLFTPTVSHRSLTVHRGHSPGPLFRHRRVLFLNAGAERALCHGLEAWPSSASVAAPCLDLEGCSTRSPKAQAMMNQVQRPMTSSARSR